MPIPKFNQKAMLPSSDVLVSAASAAMEKAIAPYSQFHVGAAIATASGKIYSGHNIEASSYSLTICAERVALFKALSEGERDFLAIAIIASSGDYCPPCGACRQVLMDFAPNLRVVLSNAHGRRKTFSLSSLLPESFSEKSLQKHAVGKQPRRHHSSKVTRSKKT